MSDPYTQSPMEPARAGTDVRDSRFDGLHAEAIAAVGYSANDAPVVANVGGATPADDIQTRVLEAQEAERSRLAQEIHDGPAQALSNAIFQVAHIERLIESDLPLARSELRYLRDLLRRELGDVRSFISQLRPPLLDQLGLDGAIVDTVEHMPE